MHHSDRAVSPEILIDWVVDARTRALDLVADLDDGQLIGPKLPTINPLLWEIGHAVWFQEKWVLRHVAGQAPGRPEVDRIYDSIAIGHDVRWDLPLLSRHDMLQYAAAVRDRVVDVLKNRPASDDLVYFVKLSVFHEDMHTEAFTYTRQTLAYPAPRFTGLEEAAFVDRQLGNWQPEDAEVARTEFNLGATRSEPFVFDNEKWSHPVRVEPYRIARYATTQAQFAAFVDDGGYRRHEFWSGEGWTWREQCGAEHPLYWQRDEKGTWLRRCFDRHVPLEPDHPMIHVNWYEADAYCRWAGRRLPSEAEWECAAAIGRTNEKRHYPWGEEPPAAAHANLDWRAMNTVPVHALPAGDSAAGCRQMFGNVWEWTATTFQPFPGFVVDPYKEYSQSCFGECKVLRGGCWTTRSRMLRNTWRNFYRPDRRDVWAGFRTCANDR